MDTQYPQTIEEAIRVVKSVRPEYYTFSNLETNIREYKGKYKSFLLKFLRKMQEENRGANRIFSLGDSEIEKIIDLAFPTLTRSKVS